MKITKAKIKSIQESKKGNIVVSIDFTDTVDILSLIRCIGKDVMGIKLHSDIIVDDLDINLNEFYTILKERSTQFYSD